MRFFQDRRELKDSDEACDMSKSAYIPTPDNAVIWDDSVQINLNPDWPNLQDIRKKPVTPAQFKFKITSDV